MENHDLWQAVLAKIELSVSKPSFLTWFQDTGITEVQNGVATVFVPNIFAKEWLQNKYHKTILHAMRELTPEVKDVSYAVGKLDNPQGQTLLHQSQKRKRFGPNDTFNEETLPIKEFTVDPETNLNPRYTFDNFVVGSFNELAHATAQSIIKNPGSGYNPLFLYGGVGLGKTHLIQAIGNELLRQSMGIKVRYVPSEKYMTEVVDALRAQEMNSLKDKYRAIDCLIIDDIQLIARTEKMQEEFFHMFNTLYQKNRQIIISSDRPPQAIATLEERLRSRFEGGMIADIGLPDFETRLLILRTKTETKKITIPEKVLVYIAENVKNNIRELEGALNRVVMAAKLSNAPIDEEAAKKIITSHVNAPKKFLTSKKILKAISEFYDLDEKEIVSHSRKKDVVKPRQIAMYLMRTELNLSYPSIGDRFGGRDHTTAIHSCEKIANNLKTSPELEEEIRMVKDRILLG